MGTEPSAKQFVVKAKGLQRYAVTANIFADLLDNLDYSWRVASGWADKVGLREGRYSDKFYQYFLAPQAPPDVLIPWMQGTTYISNFSLIWWSRSAAQSARALAFENYEQTLALHEAPFPTDRFEMDLLRPPFNSLFIDFMGDCPVSVFTRDIGESGEREAPPMGTATSGFIPGPVGDRFDLRPRAVLLSHYETAARRIQVAALVVHRDQFGEYADDTTFSRPHTRYVLGPQLFWWWKPENTFHEVMTGVADQRDNTFWRLIAKVILFMHTPGVVEERQPIPAYLRAAAKSIGHTADPAVRVMVIRPHRKVIVHPDQEPGEPTREYTYRFDVRGHWKHFRKGKMAGRVIWCPPFIKGPAGKPYRPKLMVARTKEGDDATRARTD